jgi:3',5'-cyclic AMP phosphodiesterase CpdA
MHIKPVRDARASLFQSLVDHVLCRDGPAGSPRPTLADPHVHAATVLAEHLAAGVAPPQDAPLAIAAAAGGPAAWRCLKLTSELFMARLLGQHNRATDLEAQLKDGTCDLRWIEAVEHYVDYFGLSGHERAVPYVACTSLSDAVSNTLPPSATVLVIGDWGTGTDLARALLREAATHEPDLFIHLGDIYYSGTPREAEQNFLAICNDVFDRSGGRLPIYNMSGNHDMYAGGVGYFTQLARLNPSPPFLPEQAQTASYFCLRNRSGAFQLLAMDTGLHDHDPLTVSTDVTWLEPSEAAWHLDKINGFHAAGGRTILFSHHQLFTAFEPIGAAEMRPPELQAYNPRLLETFQDVLAADKVAAWFWGHEHNLAIYEPYGPLKRGRCVGHGAIPVASDPDPYVPSPKIASPPRLVRRPESGEILKLPLAPDGAMYQHGYVILRLNDSMRQAEAAYYLAGNPATPFYRESLT